jgi:Ca-activated chloride channel homolog
VNYPRLCAFLSVATFFAAVTPLSSKPRSHSADHSPRPIAQQGTAASEPQVTVWLTVHTSENRLPEIVTKADIRVFEDGKEQSIVSLSREETEPLAVGLLMQVSGERRGTLPHNEIEPAISFFRTLLTGHNVGFVVKFAERAELVRDFTSEPAEMERGLRKAASSELAGCSDLFDAVTAVSKKLASAPAQRRAIILVGDGHDNCSRQGIPAAVEAALRAGVTIYFVNLAYADPAYKAGSALASKFHGVLNTSKQLAESTGGRIMFVHKGEDLTAAFNVIANDLGNQYKLTYNSSNTDRDGKFRTLKIDSARLDTQIVAAQGYYAPSN